MKDGKGRTIDYLRLSVTDRCNYRCRYCMGEEGIEKKDRREILSIEELSEIGRAAVAVGCDQDPPDRAGEPLLRPGIWSSAGISGRWRGCGSLPSPPTGACSHSWPGRCGRPAWTG